MTRRSNGPRAKRPKAPAAAECEVGRPTGQPSGEIGGPRGPEPTRYGDWEKNGRVTDF